MFTTLQKCVAAGGVVFSLITSGVAVAAQNSEAKGEALPLVSSSIEATNESLDAVTMLLGVAVTNQTLRQEIRARITERGTPDKAVTLRSLATSSSLRQELAKTYGEMRGTSEDEAQRAVDQLIESLPPSQVSVPVKFTSWNAANVAPLVAYVPAGIDDMDLKSVTAYDAEGRAYELDAWEEPTQPVIVIGPDETAAHGPSRDDASTATTQLVASDCYNVRLTHVVLWNDHEPWALGMAETMMTAKSDGVWYKDQFPYLEMDGDQVWPNELLGCTRNDVRFYWWEDDSGDADYILHLGQYSFGVSMANEDDLIGGRQLNVSKFVGTTVDTTDFTDLVMKTH